MTELEDLVDTMAALLGAPCTLEDTDFRLLAFSDQGAGAHAVDDVRLRSILERGSSPEVREWFQSHGIREASGPLRTPEDRERGIAARLCIPVRHQGRAHGYFWILEGDVPTDDRSWVEASAIAETAGSMMSLAERRQANRDALFRDVAEGPVREARRSAVELAAAGGLDLREPVCCVLVDRPGLADQLASRPSRAGLVWARDSGTVCAAVVRAPLVADADALPQVLTALGLTRRWAGLDDDTLVGVGPEVAGLDDLLRARAGAAVALRVARDARSASVVRWSQLGPLALLGVARDDDLAHAVIPDAVRRFVATAPPELVTTALAFLEEAGSASRTAARLAVHRQTVYQRLAQVEQLSGCRLSSGDDRLRLHLALRLVPFLPGP